MKLRSKKKRSMKFEIEALCVSETKGVQKKEIAKVRLIENFGIESDAHAGDWHRQVSFLSGEAVDKMKKEGLELTAGAFGENIVTRGIDWVCSEVGGIIRIGNTIMEITQIGKECHNPCAIFYTVGYCIMPEMGIFAKVTKGGIVHVGDYGDYHIR